MKYGSFLCYETRARIVRLERLVLSDKALAEDKLRARIAEGMASELSGPIDEDAYWAERGRALEQAPGKQTRDS